MAETSPGTVLRNLQQAQAGLKKARQALRLVREGGSDPQVALRIGWEGLARAHRIMADVPLSAAVDDVLTRQLALQRYATALLVRLRRLVRNEPGALDGVDDDFEGEE